MCVEADDRAFDESGARATLALATRAPPTAHATGFVEATV
jgi:hypothetical protein